jgi:hypothetical protein
MGLRRPRAIGVDVMKIEKVHKASCHCKAVQFDVSLPDGLVDPHRCDCSFCRMRGAITVGVPLTAIAVTAGKEKLSLYQFNTMAAKHYFCSVCGIYTFHQRRSNPNKYGVNIACLDGVNPYLIRDVPVYDGINHPSDRSKK